MNVPVSRDEALRIARLISEKEGWPWIEPVEVVARRRLPLVGRRYWQVTTNSKFGTRSVQMQIDRATARVLRVVYHPY